MLQLTKWFTWFVLVAFLTSAVFWVTRLNKVSGQCMLCQSKHLPARLAVTASDASVHCW